MKKESQFNVHLDYAGHMLDLVVVPTPLLQPEHRPKYRYYSGNIGKTLLTLGRFPCDFLKSLTIPTIYYFLRFLAILVSFVT